MKLEAEWIVGFVDGEGCFHVGINKNNQLKLNSQVLPEFTVTQHEKDIQILHRLKDYFQCGVVRRNHGDRFCYRVRSGSHLKDTIIPFFEKYRLRTRKYTDFQKFRRVLRMMDRGEHLTAHGILRIDRLRKTMNNGRYRRNPSSRRR